MVKFAPSVGVHNEGLQEYLMVVSYKNKLASEVAEYTRGGRAGKKKAIFFLSNRNK